MSFLTLDDYRSVCDDYEFKQITQNDDIRQTAEAARPGANSLLPAPPL